MTNETSTTFLLNAKLRYPRVARDSVARPRLLTLLDAGLDCPLTVVVAPAGFGKTTLVSAWVEEVAAGRRPGIDSIPVAWLSLDERDSDPNVFLRYFIAALRTLFPDATPVTLDILSGRQPPLEVLAGILSNEIETLPERCVVVLDDTHLLSGQHIFDLLSIWTHHWPQTLHLVIVSRLTPSLPLSALRAKGHLVEIRSKDLRFTSGETTEYLSRARGTPVEEPVLKILQDSLEGWIAGLKLATLSLELAVSRPSAIKEAISGDGYIADLLVNEVLAKQPEPVQHFLLEISIAPEFCESLAESLIDPHEPAFSARRCLDHLEATDLFLTGLDNRREWYRLHQFFRELLQRRLATELGESRVNELHSRAAGWYLERGFLEQALYHAVESRNQPLMIRIMQQGFRDVLNRADRPTLERWLSALPEDVIDRNPDLLLMRAWEHGLRWETVQIQQTVDRTETLLGRSNGSPESDLSPVIRGQLATLKAHTAFLSGRLGETVTYSCEALEHLPPEWAYVRGVASSYVGIGLHAIGQAAEAERFLTNCYEAAADKTDVYASRILNALALNALQSGLFQSAERTAQFMARVASANQTPLTLGWAHYILGYVHYQWNNLQTAKEHFEATVNLRYTTQLLVARNGMIGLATTYQALGDGAQAIQALDALSDFDLELYGSEQQPTISGRARVLLLRGDIDGADRLLTDWRLPPAGLPLMPWIEEPFLTRAASLLARGAPEDIQAARQLLDALEETAVKTSNARSIVEIQAMQALALAAQGDVPAARQTLIKSVEHARRSGQVRVYVDLGAPMARLMEAIRGHGTVARSVNTILDAFESAGMSDTTITSSSAGTNPPGIKTNGREPMSVEPLTTREKEILGMLRDPLSLADIARHMYISHSTVRRHTINIYHKLDVHGRWEAVSRAIELGILRPR